MNAAEARAAHTPCDKQEPALSFANRIHRTVEVEADPRAPLSVRGYGHTGLATKRARDDVVGDARVLFACTRVLGVVLDIQCRPGGVRVQSTPYGEHLLDVAPRPSVVERDH